MKTSDITLSDRTLSPSQLEAVSGGHGMKTSTVIDDDRPFSTNPVYDTRPRIPRPVLVPPPPPINPGL